jgi:hypothetical protein
MRQPIPEALDKTIAVARAQTRSRIMAVVKADGYGHGAITDSLPQLALGAQARKEQHELHRAEDGRVDRGTADG